MADKSMVLYDEVLIFVIYLFVEWCNFGLVGG